MSRIVGDTTRAVQNLLSGFHVNPFDDFSAAVQAELTRLLRNLPVGTESKVALVITEVDDDGPTYGYVKLTIGDETYVVNELKNKVYMPCKIEVEDEYRKRIQGG